MSHFRQTIRPLSFSKVSVANWLILVGLGHRTCTSCVNFQPLFLLQSDLCTHYLMPRSSVILSTVVSKYKGKPLTFKIHVWSVLNPMLLNWRPYESSKTHSLLPPKRLIGMAANWKCLVGKTGSIGKKEGPNETVLLFTLVGNFIFDL